MLLNEEYWKGRYLNQEAGWDTGSVTTPLKEYIDQLTDLEIRILIPGCGNGYEAEYLINQGFKNVFVCDLSEVPLKNLHNRCPGIPESHLLKADFFDLDIRVDLILEQTFFCAIDPSLRKKYAEKCFSLLSPGGKLAGLLFNDPLKPEGPPFGGTKEEYLRYFEPWFRFKHFDPCYNSIKPRAGRELFMCLVKK
ncbi:MAG: methyltransferase domain-containing protein [Cytophagaceae bacterium]